jgi:multiple sugar transport system permease protein
MLLYAKNTVIITGMSVIGVLLSSPLVAYGLARIDWKGRDVLFLLIVSTMMVPYQVTMIPVYLLFNSLGWINTYLPLTVPSYFGNAFFIFLLRQFFMTIPRELSDAARIDGCSELTIYARIILPLAKPSLAVVALFQFIWVWNDFLGPLIYLKDQTSYTLSLGLQQFQSGYQTEWALLMAAASMMTLPIIILFFLTQRTFIQGITLTGIKG